MARWYALAWPPVPRPPCVRGLSCVIRWPPTDSINRSVTAGRRQTRLNCADCRCWCRKRAAHRCAPSIPGGDRRPEPAHCRPAPAEWVCRNRCRWPATPGWQQRPAHPLASVTVLHHQMLQIAAAAIGPCQQAADQLTLGEGDKTQARIARQVGGDRLWQIGVAQHQSIALLPQLQECRIVIRLHGAEGKGHGILVGARLFSGSERATAGPAAGSCSARHR